MRRALLGAAAVWAGAACSGSGEEPASLRGAVAAASAARAPFSGLTEARVSVDGRCLLVVVADAPAERAQGLRGVTDLEAYDGMLFVLDEVGAPAFTMAGTPLRLDIGWYGNDGRRVDGTTMEPCPGGDEATCPAYRSAGPYRYALETPAGALGAGALTPCAG